MRAMAALGVLPAAGTARPLFLALDWTADDAGGADDEPAEPVATNLRFVAVTSSISESLPEETSTTAASCADPSPEWPFLPCRVLAC